MHRGKPDALAEPGASGRRRKNQADWVVDFVAKLTGGPFQRTGLSVGNSRSIPISACARAPPIWRAG
jgi:hypothetical protein